MFDFTQSLMHSRMNLLPTSQNNRKLPKIWKKQNSSWKTYIYVIRRLRVKVQIKILDRNSKQGSSITFWFVFNSKAKIISIWSISSVRFNFINL